MKVVSSKNYNQALENMNKAQAALIDMGIDKSVIKLELEVTEDNRKLIVAKNVQGNKHIVHDKWEPACYYELLVNYFANRLDWMLASDKNRQRWIDTGNHPQLYKNNSVINSDA